ncbi:MAG: ribose 5-phosphate isomerase B [Gemmatimonadaceae bacterium]
MHKPSLVVAIGTDHAGFPLKDAVRQAVRTAGRDVLDCGAVSVDPADDYPDYAQRVAEALLGGRAERGVLLCGSGVGISVAANKFPGVRAALCHDVFSARQGVEDDAMNVLCLGARVIGPSLAAEIVGAFLGAVFSGAERHRRRLEKVQGFERRPTR